MIQIRRLLVLLLIIICFGLVSNADNDKSYKFEGNTISSTGRVKSTQTPTETGFTWKDSKGKTYPIYISNSGSCYIIRISRNTNKEYKYYLGSELSQEICNKLGKVYKSKRK